jgi:hypothetical protein
MKRAKIILLIMFWLTSQQVAATMSAAMLAPGSMPHPGKAMNIGCHSAGSMSMLQESDEPGGSAKGRLQSSSPCCQLYCQCISIGGIAVFANTSNPPFIGHTLSFKIPYLLVIPRAPSSSLYRPPISV